MRMPGCMFCAESCCADSMGPGESGVVNDQPRTGYLDSRIRAVAAAVDGGVDVRGYCCWSLTGNFERAEGFTRRFGLVRVGYDTLVRAPKRAFDWYASLLRANHARAV